MQSGVGLDASRPVWDAWNVTHIARHGVTRSDVEEVVGSPNLTVPGHQSRLILVGPRADGRILVVVLDPEPGGFFYCVSARKANRREIRRYLTQQEGESS